MHKFLESHIQGVGYDDLTEIGQAAKPMAQKIIEVGLTPVAVYTEQGSSSGSASILNGVTVTAA